MRSTLAALVTIPVAPPAAHAQAEAIVFGVGMGYVALSTSAMARLLERKRGVRLGDSLRVITRQRGHPEFVGIATSIDDDSISIGYSDTTKAFAYGSVSKRYAYSGMESKWAEGWVVGLASGAMIGAVSGIANATPPRECDMFCPKASAAPLAYGIAGAVVASTVVAGIGALAEGPHWRTVSRHGETDDKRHMGLSPYIRPRRIGALAYFSLP
jgi:hypothetical protein